jgi:hypothetical protein
LAKDPPGIDHSNFWDASVFAPYLIPISEGLYCPLLAATEGFSCTVKLPSLVDFITDAQPLFFPKGEQLAGTI